MLCVYIIIVNYNNYKDTIECVDSVNEILYPNYKVVVVDNGSTDNSVFYLKKYLNNCIVIENKKNLGFAGGNNIGIKYALKNNADYVLLLNNDTVVEKNFLDELIKVSVSDKSIGIVGGKIYYYFEPNRIWYAGGKINKFTGLTRHIGVGDIDREIYNSVCDTQYVTGCMMLVRREAIEKAGLMDEKYFLYYEETDWNVRIKKSGYRVVYAPCSVIYHKISATTKKINYNVGCYFDRNRYYFVIKNFGYLNRLFIYFYIRIILVLKFIKAVIKGNSKKKNAVKFTHTSIKNHVMGEIKL